MRPGLLVPAMLLAATAARAQEPAPVAAPAADTAFDVLVFPTNVDRQLDLWWRVPSEVVPDIPVTGTVRPFEPIQVLIGLKNIGDTGDGRGRVTFDVTCDGADGTTERMVQDAVAWDGALPPPGIIVLGPVIELAFDGEEPLGPMIFQFDLRDAGSGTAVSRSFDLELVPWTCGDEPADAAAVGPWYARYHESPAPEQAVRAVFQLPGFEQPETGSWNFSVVGFFRTLFEDERWLLDHLIAEARGHEGRSEKALFVLHLLGEDDRIAELYPDQPEAAAQARARVAPIRLPDPYAEIGSADQLDLLWGEFFASGRYRPIRQIVSALKMVADAEALKRFKDSAQTEADRAAAIRGAVCSAAAWSLGSNIRHHERVRDYVAWMLQDDDTLGETEKGVLAAVYRKALDETK